MERIFFLLHWLGIVFVNFAWPWLPSLIYVQAIVIISWFLNDNRCLLSRIEYYYFGKTFINGSPYGQVPRFYRILLWTQFVFALITQNRILE